MDLFLTLQKFLILLLGYTLNFSLENVSATTALNCIIDQGIIEIFSKRPLINPLWMDFPITAKIFALLLANPFAYIHKLPA